MRKNTVLFVYYSNVWVANEQQPSRTHAHTFSLSLSLYPPPLDKCSVVVNYIDLGYNSL